MARGESTARVWHGKALEESEFEVAVNALESFAQLPLKTTLRDGDTTELIDAILSAVRIGENVLGYDRRLVCSDAGRDFITHKQFAAEPDRYAKEGRLLSKLQHFYKACVALRKEIWDQVERDQRFLLDSVDLPSALEKDFITARNLFSVGFDEIGVLICGRGFERVMCAIAKKKGVVMVDGKGRNHDAADCDLRDIIEVFYRLRWRATGERVIDLSTKHLLDSVRAIRNGLAHPSKEDESDCWREQAVVIAKKASHVWAQAITSKRTLKSKTVTKEW